MYLIVIGWVYVVLMMSVAEATSSSGTLLGAFVTFVLYGAGPVTLVVYLMGAPRRSKAIKKREADERAAAQQRHAQAAAATASVQPDAGGHAPGGVQAIASGPGIAPVREEP